MAHVDVVNVDRSQWEVDPLSAEVRDGFIWGRGALDDKDDAAVFVQVLRILAREGTPLSRDVILMLNADEESSGRFGARWMVEHHWDRIECGGGRSGGGRARAGRRGAASGRAGWSSTTGTGSSARSCSPRAAARCWARATSCSTASRRP